MSGHHIVTPSLYLRVLLVLMVLMTLTIIAAKWDAMNISPTANLGIALAIAVTKMTFIMLFFMHVKYSSRLAIVFAGAGFFWFVIMIVLTFADYLSRGWHAPFTVPPFGG